jgi:squalene-hopene/tetraprenyl-beta-curcumene cyclase
VREAVERARRNLLVLQQPDGHWRTLLETDVTITAEFALGCRHLGRVDEERERRIVAYLSDRQLADGSWRIHPSGAASLDATIKAHAAMKAAGIPATDARLQRSGRVVRELGGVESASVFTKIHLAILGEMSWEALPVIPPEMMLLPRTAPINIYEMSYWCRTILVPLTIVQTLRKPGHLPLGRGVTELFIAPEGRHLANLDAGNDWFSWKRFFWLLDRALKGLEPLGPRELRRRSLELAERWILQHLEGSEGLGAIHPAMLNTVYALRMLGYDWEHPVLAKAWRDLVALGHDDGDGWFMQPCLSPIWDTALAAISLQHSGSDAFDEPLVRAADWLLEHRTTVAGDWRLEAPKAPACAWAFQYRNDFYPDVDDTAMVLIALKRMAASEGSTKDGVMALATQWVRGMQSRNGGWGAFDRNNDRMVLQHVPFADHGALLDLPTPDLTGRALELLGLLGARRDDAAVRRALAYLRREQEPEGCWFGRWGVNYVYGTWSVLMGLQAVGLSRRDPMIESACAWLASVQNADGGWGETPDSYVDRSLMGRGVSTASQTSWAILALLAGGHAGDAAVTRGIEWLLRSQAADGSWPETEWTGTGFPGVLYLRYHLYPLAFPLQALGRFIREPS